MFMLLLLVGILFSMYSCQYDTVPIGTIIPIGASAVIQNNWINMRDCSWQSSLFFIILCLSNNVGEFKMLDLMCIDCNAEFDESEIVDCKCPECGSSHYDYYEEVMEWVEGCGDYDE